MTAKFIKQELVNVVNGFNKLSLYDYTIEEVSNYKLRIDCCTQVNAALFLSFVSSLLINGVSFEIKDRQYIDVYIFVF